MSHQNVIQLQSYPGGVSAGIRSTLLEGRSEIVSNGPNPEFGFIGSDPYNTNAYTGLVVPAAPSASIGGARYLFLLARASFGVGEQGPENRGVRLVGIRQYAELAARVARSVEDPSLVTFRREIVSPLWHPPDGNISWHVMILVKGHRDTRNPANTDGIIFQDALSPALLYQTLGPYTPPNGGRPWGRPLASSLGNMHELRYKWRTDANEYILDIPLPVPCDVAFFASVRQNDPALNPPSQTADQFSAVSDEDRFLLAYPTAQYGTIAGSLVFDQNIGAGTP